MCPPWSWTVGAVGVGLLTWGIVEMATADRCDRDLTITPACVSGQESIDRGVLLLSAGVPLGVPSGLGGDAAIEELRFRPRSRAPGERGVLVVDVRQ